MKTNFRIPSITSSILLGIALLSCTTQQPVEYKFLVGEHWTVIGQDTSLDMHWAHAGIYRNTEDTYVEYFAIHNSIESIGDSAVFKYTLDGDKWIVSNDWLKEEWKRIE